jgi:hypothetical protein
MEQYEDIKSELQQELQDLQQNVEQHSTFNREVWQRAVKRYSKHLYMQNLLSVIFLVVIITASNFILCEYWPWWLLLPSDLFLGWITLDSLIATNGLRKADAQSREGLLSLRDSIQKSTTYSKRKRIVIQVVGIIISLLIYVYLFFYDRSMFFTLLVSGLLSIPVVIKTSKRVKKRFDELNEEIDELLNESRPS